MLSKVVHLVLPNERDTFPSPGADQIDPGAFSVQRVPDTAQCYALIQREDVRVLLITALDQAAAVADVVSAVKDSRHDLPIICISDTESRRTLLEEQRPRLWDVLLPSELGRLPLSLQSACEHSNSIEARTKLRNEITQARALLADNQKNISIGRLLGSIAHEINNPLEAIANLLFLTERNINDQEFIRECVRLAEEELTRVSEITKQILTFHRDSKQAVDTLVTEAIESVLSLHEARLRRSHVQVRRLYQTEGSVHAHPGELRQIFSNLISNAIDAMPDGGRLTIRVRRGSCLERALCVTVADTGCGMPQSIKERIGELYFTTKGESGTGIGLWVTRQLIEKYGGTLRVLSSTKPDKSGTYFRICFHDPPACFDTTGYSAETGNRWQHHQDLSQSQTTQSRQKRRA